MLQVTFHYQGEQPIFETLRNLQFKYENENYLYFGEGYRATITHEALNKTLTLTFSQELSFDQYKHLHKMIKQIGSFINAEIDDSKALMGYLKNGNEAYIIHQWNEWLQFLEEAKHTSMEGQKVQVYEHSLLRSEGILIDAKKEISIDGDFTISSCTIITKNGEQKLQGKDLKIIATGEF